MKTDPTLAAPWRSASAARLAAPSLRFLAEPRPPQAATYGLAIKLENIGAEPTPVVYVIDDDAKFREALARIFRSVGLHVKVFGSAAEFLQIKLPDVPSCLVLDVRLPGLSGLDFQSELVRANIHIPIVFMTGHGDIPMTVRAMKAGAVEFLPKPFREQDMLDAVRAGIDRDRARRKIAGAVAGVRCRFESLTPREREIMTYVTAGLMNKQIAGETGLGEATVKAHRGSAMQKLRASSLAELVRMADALGLRPPAKR